MNTEINNELAMAFCNAQREMAAVAKSAENPFFKSKYADLESVIDAVKEVLNNNGISFMQHPVFDEGRIGVKTVLLHVSGQREESLLLLPLAKQDPQAAGAAITYARRYALQSICGLPAVDDDAESAMSREPKITVKQVDEIRQALEKTSLDETELCQKVRITKLADLSASRFNGCMDFIGATYANEQSATAKTIDERA
jgi:hypothetical protein